MIQVWSVSNAMKSIRLLSFQCAKNGQIVILKALFDCKACACLDTSAALARRRQAHARSNDRNDVNVRRADKRSPLNRLAIRLYSRAYRHDVYCHGPFRVTVTQCALSVLRGASHAILRTRVCLLRIQRTSVSPAVMPEQDFLSRSRVFPSCSSFLPCVRIIPPYSVRA